MLALSGQSLLPDSCEFVRGSQVVDEVGCVSARTKAPVTPPASGEVRFAANPVRYKLNSSVRELLVF